MKKCFTPAMVRAELNRMPETIDQIYERILQGIPKIHQQFVQSAIHWLAFFTRPLLHSELAEAVAINPSAGKFDPDQSRFMDENKILDLCGSLTMTSTKEYIYGSKDWLTEKAAVERTIFSSPRLPVLQVVSLTSLLDKVCVFRAPR
jgi:hypothetical protein